jgi:hypothetical protein
MSEMPGKIRVQDAVLANMVSIAAILEFLEGLEPGAKAAIEQRAHEIANRMKAEMEGRAQAEGGSKGE